ncbi:MAG: hypothetical protein HOH43_25565 [Candidatus Latescibacteria bacterium]|nr:hypothetical protein [Candidatus Latescibacterota bacterium]
MTTQSFPMVEVSGDAYSMGHQHGEQAGNLVHRYLSWIDRITGQSRDVLCANALAILPQMEALSPAFIQEVRGLAEGARISFEEALLCQARAEASKTREGGCSAFALSGEATADGRPLAGQNQDLEAEYGDVSILLKVKPNDGRPAALMFTFAGQLGYAGMNEHGVAHFANALYDAPWQPALPHYPLKRLMLEQKTVGDCVSLLRENRTCSAANVVLADGEGSIGDVEVRPDGIALFKDTHEDALLHTNHYLTSEYLDFETHSLADSAPRLSRLGVLIREAWGQITVDVLKDILADHEGDPAGICRHGAVNMHSISGYIAEPSKRLFHVRRGHGCLGSWETHEVSRN